MEKQINLGTSRERTPTNAAEFPLGTSSRRYGDNIIYPISLELLVKLPTTAFVVQRSHKPNTSKSLPQKSSIAEVPEFSSW